jgi:hypothetical protein
MADEEMPANPPYSPNACASTIVTSACKVQARQELAWLPRTNKFSTGHQVFITAPAMPQAHRSALPLVQFAR